MLTANRVHIGDIGTDFQATIQDESGSVVDLSFFTVFTMIFVKPDSTKVSKTATKLTSGTDGKIHYTATTGDIDQAGTWSLQAFVEIDATHQWYSNIYTFTVDSNVR